MTDDLECVDVSKRFGRFTAVDDVTFGVPRGSFFSILGPSGCGKTTLMRMIAGFETPSAGDIRLKGRSVLADPPNRRNVKMVFQHLALFPMMNVGENIAYGLRCRGAGRAEIAAKVGEVLARIGLPGVEGKEIGQLSGGQKQRIAIARCMVLEPDVLLLDEPLGALDLKLRERMKIELKQLQTQFDTTFLYITHDQSEALVMSDRIAVMNAGRFEQVGTPQELYHQPASAFVAGFVGDANRWRGRVVSAEGGAGRVRLGDGTEVAAGWGAGPVAAGGPVEIFVRPEAIRIGGDALHGIVEGLLFNGASSRVLVRAAGELVEVDDPQQGTIPRAAGEAVTLGWEPGAARAFAVGA